MFWREQSRLDEDMAEEQATGTGPAAAGPGSPGPAAPASDGPDGPGPSRTHVRAPLRRSTHDRYIAGVCGGVGRATDVDPVIYRVVLAVLTFFGGIGVLLYALGWLLLPADGEEQSEAQKLLSGRGRSSSVLPLIGVAVSTILVIAFISAGADIAIVVIIAFVVFAVVLSKQRQDASGPETSGTGVTPTTPGASTPAFPVAPSIRPAQPYDVRRVPASSFSGPYSTGPYPTTTPAGFGAPWPGTDPYVTTAPAPPEPPTQRERRGSWLGFLTLAVAAVVGGVLVATGVPDSDSGVSVVVASVLVVIGLGLVVGTWAGRSRGLIAWGILATLALVAVATFDVPLRGGTGERRWTPATVAAAEAAPYRLTAGEGRLDLSDIRPPAGSTADVEASVTVGRLVVDVPADATIEVNGHVGMGHLALQTDPGRSVDRGGLNVTANYTDAAETAPPATGSDPTDSPTEAATGRIVLDLEVGLGELEVRRAPASR
jgi:phage shock protein PspC (stress-responsive transcriptional regulator)